MIKLSVPDMSCGHCAATIEKAVRSVDGKASVRADIAAKTVTVDTAADAAAIARAIDSAGYPNRPAP